MIPNTIIFKEVFQADSVRSSYLPTDPHYSSRLDLLFCCLIVIDRTKELKFEELSVNITCRSRFLFSKQIPRLPSLNKD